jgi:hypothetical protein
MLRSMGTMTVTGMFMVVSSTLISCASACCIVKDDVIMSTIGLIAFVTLLGYDCGAGAGLAIPDGVGAAPAPCVKSILAPCCPPDRG